MRTFTPFYALLVSLLMLTGCKTTEWSNYPYNFSCDVFAPPYPPCVIDVSGDGFKYKGQFEACKTDVRNYDLALQNWSQCANDDARILLNNINDEVRTAFSCLEQKFMGDAVDEALACPKVTIPRNIELYSVKSTAAVLVYVDAINFSANVPSCVRDGSKGPTDEFSYKFACRDHLVRFLNSSSQESAQQQYDRFVNWLDAETRQRANTVVEQFNCVADGKYSCTMPMF